jgi:ribosomal protein L11 methyltransferase
LFSLVLHVSPDRQDYLVAELSECGVLGISEEAGGLRAFFGDDVDASQLAARFANFGPELAETEAIDWEQVSRQAWPPLPIGERLYLVAPWCQDEAPAGRLRLEIEPGMACGTGRHPATQLCLEALEQYIRPEDLVLDIGTGSGILAAAARLLGAGRVVGCDLDPEAIAFTRPRVGVPLFVGSVDAVRTQSQDLIVANIDAATLEALRPELERVRKGESRVILSGFPEWDVPRGFQPKHTIQREEWLCFVCWS